MTITTGKPEPRPEETIHSLKHPAKERAGEKKGLKNVPGAGVRALPEFDPDTIVDDEA